MSRSQLFFLVLLLGGPVVAQEPVVKSDQVATHPKTDPVESAEKPLNFWMQKKLDYSTGILRGLSLGDFEIIETNAAQMRLLNKIEGFVHSRNPGYRTNVHTFERVMDEVIRQAKKKNIDGVTLAYHQLTTSCVRCHQTLREPESE